MTGRLSRFMVKALACVAAGFAAGFFLPGWAVKLFMMLLGSAIILLSSFLIYVKLMDYLEEREARKLLTRELAKIYTWKFDDLEYLDDDR